MRGWAKRGPPRRGPWGLSGAPGLWNEWVVPLDPKIITDRVLAVKEAQVVRVAGIDGTPGGWAVVVMSDDDWSVRKAVALSDVFGDGGGLDIVAVDVPIGLLTSYEVGGRACDRAARAFLGRPRGSSVFPAPVRPVLGALSWEGACSRSWASGPNGRAVSKQTYAILDKIKEADDLLQSRPGLRRVVRAVHPEVSFAELAGGPMVYRKSSAAGREERRRVLVRCFPELGVIEKTGRASGLPTEDILDAAVSAWSALRLAEGRGRSLPNVVTFDVTGLPMAIWV